MIFGENMKRQMEFDRAIEVSEILNDQALIGWVRELAGFPDSPLQLRLLPYVIKDQISEITLDLRSSIGGSHGQTEFAGFTVNRKDHSISLFHSSEIDGLKNQNSVKAVPDMMWDSIEQALQQMEGKIGKIYQARIQLRDDVQDK